MKKVLLAAMLTIGSVSQVWAGTGSGKVLSIMPHAGDVVMFTTEHYTSNPGCNVYDKWALSLSTKTGEAMFKTLMMAMVLGKSVLVTGTHTCSVWGDRESPHWIALDY